MDSPAAAGWDFVKGATNVLKQYIISYVSDVLQDSENIFYIFIVIYIFYNVFDLNVSSFKQRLHLRHVNIYWFFS